MESRKPAGESRSRRLRHGISRKETIGRERPASSHDLARMLENLEFNLPRIERLPPPGPARCDESEIREDPAPLIGENVLEKLFRNLGRPRFAHDRYRVFCDDV